jgi:hypothetical protein
MGDHHASHLGPLQALADQGLGRVIATTICTLLPRRRFVPSYPARLPLSGLDWSVRLSKIVARMRRAIHDFAQQHAQIADNGFEDADLEPVLGLLVDPVPGWQVVGQHPPSHTGTHQRV